MASLVYAPQQILARERRWEEVGGLALLALSVTMIYESRMTGLFEQVRYMISPRGHWDMPAVRYLGRALWVAVHEGVAGLFVVGGIVVPLLLLFVAGVAERRPLFVVWRAWYRRLLSAALASWAAAVGIMILPTWLLFPSEAPRYAAALGVAVFPPFAFFMALVVRQMLALSAGRTLAVLLPALTPLLAAPLVGRRTVGLAASPALLLIIHQLLMPVIARALSRPHPSRDRGQPAIPSDDAESRPPPLAAPSSTPDSPHGGATSPFPPQEESHGGDSRS